MLLKRIFDITVTIRDFNIIYSADLDSNILDIIRKNYENTNYKGCYINSVNKILYRSHLENNCEDLEISFNVNVVFEAECLIYSMDEIILDMKVVKVTNECITLNKKNVFAIIKIKNNILDIQTGQLLPFIVRKAHFDIKFNKIKINGMLMVPKKTNIQIYKVGPLNEYDKERLSNIIENIYSLNEDIHKYKKNKLWKTFSNIMYPYKENKHTYKKFITVHDLISNLDILENKYIYCDNTIDSDLEIIPFSENEPENYIEMSSYEILYDQLKSHYLHNHVIINLITNYGDDFDKYKNIFDLYEKNKL